MGLNEDVRYRLSFRPRHSPSPAVGASTMYDNMSKGKQKWQESLKCLRHAQSVDKFAAPPELDDRGHDCDVDGCERVVLNVSGMRFETQQKTLNRLPHTLLGDPEKRNKFWDERRKEYFFDRHRPSFQAVLYYYQSGGFLQRPYEVPIDVFVDELLFFGISAEAIDKLRESEGIILEKPKPLPENETKRKIWLLFDFPTSSRAAYVTSMLTIVIIIMSVGGFCIETLPSVKTNYGCHLYKNQIERDSLKVLIENPFFVVESICVAWFTIEYTFRILSCPSKVQFIKSFLNTVDLVSILPFYTVLAVHEIIPNMCSATNYMSLLAIVRCVRIVRIFKLGKHFTSLRVLSATIKSTYNNVATFFLIFFITMLTFSSLMYLAESRVDHKGFTSIPASFWYVVVTMTTVGYGDVAPITRLGRFIGSFCVISGVLVIALSLPVIVTNFIRFYAQATGRPLLNL